MMNRRLIFLIGLLFLLGCQGQTAVPTPTATATKAPTALAVSTATPQPPTATAPAEPTAVAANPTLPAPTATTAVEQNGRTADGAYFLGHPDAPITLIDYSDFL